ncbi:MAG: UvrB/UvrC motif-containing protein, partial [Candidatus Nanopelagicales bacterium]
GGRSRAGGRRGAGGSGADARPPQVRDGRPAAELATLIQDLTEQMHAAAANLQFEVAARYRDEVSELKRELRGMVAAG